jgi:hypothetical protein
MDVHWLVFCVVVALTIIIVGAVASYKLGKCRAKAEPYLVYPYLDLDTPGVRGSYYALSESR